MKIAPLALAAVMLAGTVAQAQYYRPGYGRHGGYRDGYRDGRHHRGGDSVAVGIACAPEVLQGNVAATDRILTTLASSSDFKGATQFQTEVKRIAALPKADERAAEYFNLIGVDASNKDAVVEFVGARDVKQSQVVELVRATGLTDAQANKVAASLQTSLRGDLK